MKTIKDTMHEKGWIKDKLWMVCLLLLVIQIGVMVYENVFLIPLNLDDDSAEVLRHTIEMWNNKKIIIPAWDYTTTLELDSNPLFAIFFYGIFKNIYIAAAFSNAVYMFIWLWTLYHLFGKNFAFLLSANLVFIPYVIGMYGYFNMIFFSGSQYVVKALLPIMLVAILTHAEDDKDKTKWSDTIKKQIVFLVLYAVLLFINALSTGAYVILCGLTPVLVGYLLYKWYTRDQFQVKTFGFYAGLTAIISGLGYYWNVKLGINALGNERHFEAAFFNNFLGHVGGLYETFGAVALNGEKVISIEGFSVLCRIFLVTAFFFFMFIAIRNAIHKKASLRIVMLTSVLVWNVIVVSMTSGFDSLSTSRYTLMGAMALICLSAEGFTDSFAKLNYKVDKIIMISTLLFLLVFIGFTSNQNVIANNTHTEKYQYICDYANGNSIKNIYFLRDKMGASICRILDYDNQDILYASIDNNDEIELQGKTRVYIHDFYDKYNTNDVKFDDTILVLDRNRFQFEDGAEMFGHTYHFVESIEEYDIYR